MKKDFTRFLHPTKGKCRSLMTLVLMCAATAGAWAQEESGTWSGWVGEQLPTDGGDFYLYNKVGNAFFLGANDWGTQISLGDPGIEVTLEKLDDGQYYIKTYENGTDIRRVKNGYIDGAKDTEWIKFNINGSETVDIGYEYTISNGSNFIYYGGSGTTLKYDGSNSEAQWLLVSKQQRIESLDYATAENGVDATFYLVGAGFSRMQPNNWMIRSGNVATSYPTTNETANRCQYAQATNNPDGFDMYQDLTELKNGVYEITCQGFYRPGATVDANGTQNAVLYANSATRLLPLLADDGEGIPSEGNNTGTAFNNGRFNNVGSITVVVTDGTLRVGVKAETGATDDWCAVDNFRLTYYGESEKSEEQLAFENALSELEGLITSFTSLGANAVVTELKQVYNQYKDTQDDWSTATTNINTTLTTARNAQAAITTLKNSINTSDTYYNNVKDVSDVYLIAPLKNAISTALTATNSTFATVTLDNAATTCSEQATALDNAVTAAQTWFGLPYTLYKAQELADKIGGLSDTDEYKTVVADMTDTGLTFAKVMEDVAALNAKCRAAITPSILQTASTENPIDMTSFITNPNIYQTKATTEMPDGWDIIRNTALDNKNFTPSTSSDTELQAYNWSGNSGNSIGDVQYSTTITNLPDGQYVLKAATHITVQPECVSLYASVDNTNMTMANVNGDWNNYANAAGVNDGTTTELTVTVMGGTLHAGIVGTETVTGTGRSWRADNFRLYYVGAPEAIDLTITSVGYATCYAPNAFTVPEGMTAGIINTVDSENNSLTIDWCYTEGSTVPALTGVMLKGDAKTYACAFSTEAVSKPKTNYLNGTLEETTIDAEGYKYYKLANDTENGLGFYYATQDGTSITNAAGKAYLALPAETAAEVSFLKWDLDATGIENATADSEETTVDVYTLSGICVRSNAKASSALQGLHKGVYIINGKKLVIK